ncbi:MAG: anaerobic ribonucleoside-triphosphate reductase activating protein [Paramuribaculum sp.]|nr:anaerobic ribonucleoside-triphosphate reductase activating protein [Paramuribaculum sp.]
MRVIDIIDGTTVDGPGFRTSIYFAGCLHHCEGCHNPQSWDMEAGKEMSIDEILTVVDRNDMDVSLSGGDPMYQAGELVELCRKIKSKGLSIWLYTGFLYEELLKMPLQSAVLEYIDVVVDGPFILDKRDTSLLFRGSSNQRIIDVKASSVNNIVAWKSDF